MTAAQRSSADNSITGKGQLVTVTHRAAGAYDAATGASAITETTQTAYAVIFPFGPGLRKMPGSTITADDQQCLLSALNTVGTAVTAPIVNDTLTDVNGVVHTITEVSPLAPAGMTIMYDLTIRRNG